MCFRIDSTIPVITATKRQSMRVFKKVTLHVNRYSVRIISPYYEHIWFDGNTSEFPTTIEAVKVEVNFNGDFGEQIGRGYHSYLSPMCDSVDILDREKLIIKILTEKELLLDVMLQASIPPNSMYRINTSGHCVSDNIIIYTTAVVVDKYKHKYFLSYLDIHNLIKLRKNEIFGGF